MATGRVPEDDAFERAAAQLRPEWQDEDGEPASAPQPSKPEAAAPAVHVEPTVIVQSDMELIASVPDAEHDFPETDPRGGGQSAIVRSGFTVPSSRARHEATVVTKALPTGLAALLNKPEPAAFAGDDLALAQAERARKLRLGGIGAAAAIAIGVVIALLSRGDEPQPIAPTPPAVVAPVVQPLPAVIPAPAATNGRPSATGASNAAKASREPVAKKKTVAPVAAKPAPVKQAKPAASKPAPSKPALAAKPAAKATKNVPAKPAAKAKPAPKATTQPDASKRARSPIDVLNPWGS